MAKRKKEKMAPERLKPLKKHRYKPPVQDTVEALLFAFVVAMIVRNYTFQNFKIPSASMETTLLTGDYLVADKLAYMFSEPERGDIVTFLYPADPVRPDPDRYSEIYHPLYWDWEDDMIYYHAQKDVVKRVIGVPGDTLQIVNGQVFIDGESLDEPYIQRIDPVGFMINRGAGLPPITWNPEEYPGCDINFGDFSGQRWSNRDNFGPVVVPHESYFMMGDNRDVSADSRYWGFLDQKLITGTPALVFFSIGEKPLTGPLDSINDLRRQYEYNQRHGSSFRSDRFMKWVR